MNHGIEAKPEPRQTVVLGEGMEVQFSLGRDSQEVAIGLLPPGFYTMAVGGRVPADGQEYPYQAVTLLRQRNEGGRLFTKQYTAQIPINEDGIAKLRAGECPPLVHIERRLTKKDYGERLAIGAAVIAAGSLLVKRLYGKKK